MKRHLIAFAIVLLPAASLTIVPINSAIAGSTTSKLGDLSAMRKIVADTLTLVKASDTKTAVKRITEFETTWDKNAAKLQKRDKSTWTKLDDASDVALSSVRYPTATPAEMQKDLSALIALFDNPNL